MFLNILTETTPSLKISANKKKNILIITKLKKTCSALCKITPWIPCKIKFSNYTLEWNSFLPGCWRDHAALREVWNFSLCMYPISDVMWKENIILDLTTVSVMSFTLYDLPLTLFTLERTLENCSSSSGWWVMASMTVPLFLMK